MTPEYVKNVLKAHPDAVIYALRLDRGLSPADVLATPPGTRWDDERGLDGKQYIVPGAGVSLATSRPRGMPIGLRGRLITLR